jgi:parallel beta-helix repeat protein
MTKLAGIWLVFCSLFSSVGIATAQLQDPSEAARSCSTVITACGCVITTSDTYTVANDLNADQTKKPNCIEIAASYSILNLKGFAVIGSGYYGSSVGILIRKGADHVVVQGGDEAGATQANDAGTNGQDFPGAQAVVTQWNYGIEDDGDDAVIELFKQLGGNIFQQHDGNATAGILLNGVKRSIASDLQASYNGQAGVIVKDSTGTSLFNLSTIGNQESGIWLDSSDDSTIGTASAAGNGTYGIWLMQSSRNLVVNANGTSGNGDTGILLGCGKGNCTGSKYSNNNRITNSGAPGNQIAGIVIEKHSDRNIITVTHNDGNGDYDMVDDNPQCANNIWYNNTGSGNRKCIH